MAVGMTGEVELFPSLASHTYPFHGEGKEERGDKMIPSRSTDTF